MAMNLNDAEVTVLLDACLKDGSLVITDNRRLRLKKTCCIPEFDSDEKMHEFLRLVVPNKSVTAEAAARMEEVLNLYCSEENLHELMDVLIGELYLNPALVQVARKLSEHSASKMDWKDNFAFENAWKDECLSGKPHASLIKKCVEEVKDIETMSRGSLISFIEWLLTWQKHEDRVVGWA